MRRGDIEIHLRGRSFADIEADKLLEAVAAIARLFPNHTVIGIRRSYIALRRREPTEPPCPSSPFASTTTSPSSVGSVTPSAAPNTSKGLRQALDGGIGSP